jgi:hypothetical protein
MSSSSRVNIDAGVPVLPDSAGRLASQTRSTRDRLSLQSDSAARYNEEAPEVLELEATGLDAARHEMAGATSMLRGEMEEGNFRAIFRGERAPLTFREICRLRLSDRPEARRATDAIITVLLTAGRVAFDLTLDKVLNLLTTSTACVDQMARRLEDGVIDRDDALAVLPAVRVLAARVVAIVTALEAVARDEKGGAR